jgi:hypothetical protein
MAPFPELLKVMRLALVPPVKVKHRKPHQATIFVRLLYLSRVLLSGHWLRSALKMAYLGWSEITSVVLFTALALIFQVM